MSTPRSVRGTERPVTRVFAAASLVLFASLSLSTCDGLREKLIAVIRPVTPEESLVSINTKLALGQFKEAKEEAEPRALIAGPLQGQFDWAAAKVSAGAGEVDLALKHLLSALKFQAVTPSVWAIPSVA
jgi:hypothetical protein